MESNLVETLKHFGTDGFFHPTSKFKYCMFQVQMTCFTPMLVHKYFQVQMAGQYVDSLWWKERPCCYFATKTDHEGDITNLF